MDPDIARWILDFLARQPIEDSTLSALLKSLPVSDTDTNLKTLLLLRNLESEISNNTVSETVLDLLEHIEELEHRENVKASESLKRAYCDVAVDCAVRVLENEGMGRFYEVAKRVWRGKIGDMLKCENVGLVSYDLICWKDDIESAVWDDSVCKEVLEKWKKMDAVGSVREYVKDAREKMGPSFLEEVCEGLSDEALREVFGFNMEEDEENHDQADATKEDEDSHDQTDATGDNLMGKGNTVQDESADGAGGRASGPQLPTLKKSAVSPVKEVFRFNAEDEDSHDQTDATKDTLMGEGSNVRDESADGAAGRASRPHLPIPKKSVVTSVKEVFNVEDEDSHSHDQTNATKDNLMGKDKTVRNESTDGAAGRASGSHLPTPKKSVVSPMKKDENPKPLRRKRKPWSNEEEDTLRAGVKRFGVGNWKLILNTYEDIFDDRTAVDLKDKWRNLIV